ncbi:hypothetical protein [Vibrio jasicida]|uniref:hypothetical protein n=1 Tax=Vibrio jasicida TaxID=766224 RepID=UPI0005F08870|nr:hypothetical protein [Vibrio jasicida]
MSQHVFQAQRYRVLCGWDRPLQGFFLVIEHPLFDEPCYSNLYETTPHPPTFEPFLTVLSRHGITPPDGLLDTLAKDKANNAGNSLTEWKTQ